MRFPDFLPAKDSACGGSRIHRSFASLRITTQILAANVASGCWHDPRLFLLSLFGDVDDFMLENEEVRTIIAGHADHIFVVVLDPAANDFPVSEFEADDLLLLAERLQSEEH